MRYVVKKEIIGVCNAGYDETTSVIFKIKPTFKYPKYLGLESEVLKGKATRLGSDNKLAASVNPAPVFSGLFPILLIAEFISTRPSQAANGKLTHVG